MSEEITTDTLIAGENVQSVTTEAEAETSKVEQNSEEKAKPKAPKVEVREGNHMYVDGVRVYSRDETNMIASKARNEVESKLLADLEVDSFDSVKQVVSELRNTDIADSSLNVQSLRDAVAKREQTVEELRAELQAVKTDYALREHIGTLRDNMPTQWNADQKSAVVDLMKARNMLHLEGETFAIKNGEDYFTTDGETPDYKLAVEVVGKTLGLPFAKKGVESFDADRQPSKAKETGADVQTLIKSDPNLRNAYVKLRGRGLKAGDITESKLRSFVEKSGYGQTQHNL
jgi:hypothetical protein